MAQVSLAEGTVVHGTYRLTRLLGEGGMGAVWEATHMRLPKQVAIKFLLGAATGSPELTARFRREAEIASRLSHPRIVEVHDFNSLEDGTPYLVMERLRGHDLRAALADGPLSLEQAREVVVQVASALSLAHREGVVHRDLKPENIFLCETTDGSTQVKVLDFGISKLQDSATLATREDRILGTPGYMAPEQVMGQNAAIDARTDLFALAAIFYELVTGENVFVGNTLAEVVYKVVHHRPAPLGSVMPGVPPAVSSAVERALSKDQSARQDSVQGFVDALSARASASDRQERESAVTVAAEPIDPAQTVPTAAAADPPPRPGRPWGWALGGALVAFLGLALVALRWMPDADGPPPSSEARASESVEGVATDPALAESVPPHAAPQPEGLEAAPASEREGSTPEKAGPLPGSAPQRTSPAPATRPRRAAAVPAEVRETLEAAERALHAGDLAEAMRLARSSLYARKTSRAFAIMARVYCRRKDVGNAAAMLRNVRGRDGQAVRKDCASHGVALGN